MVARPDELAGVFTAAGLAVATVMPPMAAAVATLGPRLAEEHGIPHVAAPSGGGQQMRPALVDDALRARSGELGLAATATDLHRHGRLDRLPPGWSFVAEGVAPAWSYRQARFPTTTIEVRR